MLLSIISPIRRVLFCVGVFLVALSLKDLQRVVLSQDSLSVTNLFLWGMQSKNIVVRRADVRDVSPVETAAPTDIYPVVYDLHVVLADRVIVLPNWRGREKVFAIKDAFTNKKVCIYVNMPYLFVSFFGFAICFLSVFADGNSVVSGQTDKRKNAGGERALK